jgi:hypothetical protein
MHNMDSSGKFPQVKDRQCGSTAICRQPTLAGSSRHLLSVGIEAPLPWLLEYMPVLFSPRLGGGIFRKTAVDDPRAELV